MPSLFSFIILCNLSMFLYVHVLLLAYPFKLYIYIILSFESRDSRHHFHESITCKKNSTWFAFHIPHTIRLKRVFLLLKK